MPEPPATRSTDTVPHRVTDFIIQPYNSGMWSRLAPCQPFADIERDERYRYLPQTRNPSPSEDLDELLGTTSTEISTPSSNFTLSPAVWTPQEVGAVETMLLG